MKIFHSLALGFLMGCCTSCVFYAPPVKHGNQVHKSDVVLYGRFFYGRHFEEEPDPAWFTTGLWVRNEATDRTVYIEFKDTNSVYGVRVEPGWYHITGFVRSDNEHGVKNRQAFSQTNMPAALTERFEAQAGSQIYIGDYIWETKLDYPMISWRLKSIDDNCDATTAEFRRSYPELPATPTESIFDRKLHGL